MNRIDGNQPAYSPGSALRKACNLVCLARPKDWIKNVFVLLPLPFALKAGSSVPGWPFLWGLAGFCLITSAVYALNDLLDAEADRLHPAKRRRPVATGAISGSEATVWTAVLLTIGVSFSWLSGSAAAVWLSCIYLIANVSYSTWAKHVAILDVFVLSSGFVLRVLLGCALIGTAPSGWLLLCTTALALFLGFAKRRADLTAGLDHHQRPSLRDYNQAFLDQAVSICAGVSIVSYALYSIEAKAFLAGREMVPMPFVAYGILNYLRMTSVEGVGGSPVDIAYRSRATQICAIGWAVAVSWSLGMW